MVKRGEIWLVEWATPVPSQQPVLRLCVVVSPTELNQHLQTVLVAPMSSAAQLAPFRVSLMHAGKRGVILLEQVQAVERSRLKTRVGALSNTTQGKMLQVLQELFAE